MTMELLTIENAKTTKGESLGYLTGIQYLAPARSSGVMNVCGGASDGCIEGCLNLAGLAGVFQSIIDARIRKTRWLASDRVAFMSQLEADVEALVRKAAALGLKPAVRLNGTSDLPWMALQLCDKFPDVQFYDYTKLPNAWRLTRPNYHLTFSLHEKNLDRALAALAHGMSVAVVFDTRKGLRLCLRCGVGIV